MSAPQSFRQHIGLGRSTVDLTSNAKSTALVVIDAQKEYSPAGKLAISGIDKAQKVIGETVAKFRTAGAQVVFVQHDAGAGAPVFDPNGDKFDYIDDDVRPKSGEHTIVKHAPSSFTATDLDEVLKKHGIKQLVLSGYMAHVCVTGTARSSMEHGYDTVIIKDAIGDRDVPGYDGKGIVKAEQLVETVCHELNDAIGTVIQSSEIKG